MMLTPSLVFGATTCNVKATTVGYAPNEAASYVFTIGFGLCAHSIYILWHQEANVGIVVCGCQWLLS